MIEERVRLLPNLSDDVQRVDDGEDHVHDQLAGLLTKRGHKFFSFFFNLLVPGVQRTALGAWFFFSFIT